MPTPGKTRGAAAAEKENRAPGSGSAPWLKQILAIAVDGGSLAVLRICLGLVMCLEAWSLTRPSGSISSGATPLETYFTGADVTFNFPYTIVGWLPLFPPAVIHALVGLLAVSGLTFALGFCYRASAVILFLAWGYFFAAESTRTYWQSYYYTELLFLFLMIWMPAANRFSVDAWLQKRKEDVPFWTIFLLRGQLVIAYFYGGVSKLNADWLLDAVPVRWFLALPEVTRPYEAYLSTRQFEFFQGILQSVGFAYFVSYAGLLFDLCIGFLLLARRTRYFALACMFLFHATNHFLIFDDIDWFPLVGITTTLIFLEPDWPQRFWSWLRKPRFTAPEWNWFVVGAVLLPLVGALLGWKARPAKWGAGTFALGRIVPVFVFGWLAWQAVMPLRHWLIPGDGRFTYQGQSFSWRLKAETRLASAHQLFIRDPAIISTNSVGMPEIHWTEWKGEKVIYRLLEPGSIPWATLPEFVVTLEPILGERIIYNPMARGISDEAAARQRIAQAWQESYGRAPQFIGRTRPVAAVLASVANNLRASGHAVEAASMAELASLARGLETTNAAGAAGLRTRITSALLKLHGRDMSGSMTPLLRPLDPFILQGEARSSEPFMVIEDLPLFEPTHPKRHRIARESWKTPGATDGATLAVCIGPPGPEARQALPEAAIFQAEGVPYIWWNSAKDLSWSKYQHTSYQAFYLRRYARRVAGKWETQYGRRPTVNARTSVSLNGRPPQPLVRPEVDLASVPVRWFGHNDWIYDLQTKRVPPESLAQGAEFVHRSGN